jgi:hypothetical protein
VIIMMHKLKISKVVLLDLLFILEKMNT